jgi:hypothetical protein
MHEETTCSRPPLRWYQFSLRTLLLVSLCLALVLGTLRPWEGARLPDEDHPILCAALKAFAGNDSSRLLIVDKSTIAPEEIKWREEVVFPAVLCDLLALDESALTSLLERNRRSYRLPRTMGGDLSYRLASIEQAKVLSEKEHADCVWVSISRPGIDLTGSQAVVFVQSRTVYGGGYTLLVLLRDNGRWQISRIRPVQ